MRVLWTANESLDILCAEVRIASDGIFIGLLPSPSHQTCKLSKAGLLRAVHPRHQGMPLPSKALYYTELPYSRQEQCQHQLWVVPPWTRSKRSRHRFQRTRGPCLRKTPLVMAIDSRNKLL